MAGAIELIVDGYVRLNDRKALDDLCTQRRKLVADLNASTGIDCSSTILQIEGKRDFLRTVTPALLTDGLRIEGGI